MAYIYSHHKADTKEIFYIGIGASEDGKNPRAYDSNKRSRFWKSIVKRHGFFTEILADNIEWKDAINMEVQLIAKYGRSNNGTGILCNLTDGGEGCKGFVATPEYREKISKALKGKLDNRGEKNPFYGKKHSKESIEKRATAIKESGVLAGENNPNYGKSMPEAQKELLRQKRTGTKHKPETIEKIRAWGKGKPKSEEWKAKNSGANNYFYGKGHLLSGDKAPRAMHCTYIETGEIYKCLKVACQEKGLSYNTQIAYIKPSHKRHKNRKFNRITI